MTDTFAYGVSGRASSDTAPPFFLCKRAVSDGSDVNGVMDHFCLFEKVIE